MRQVSLADGIDLEPNGKQRLMIQHVSAVENEGRLRHGVIDSLVVQFLILFPFRHHSNGVDRRVVLFHRIGPDAETGTQHA